MEVQDNPHRLVVAGLSGDAGKSLVSLAILHHLRQSGLAVRAFKKGPDYIDTAWLSWASGQPAWNLDSWMMGFDRAALSFHEHCQLGGMNVIEGNRGLFDGVDAAGTHSTAELAKAIHAPVLLVVNVAKMTRTAGALVLGCQHLDRDLNLAGVVVNRVHGARHEAIVRASIEGATGIPVVGAIPAMTDGFLPGRHLGLVTPSDSLGIDELPLALETVAARLDMQGILRIASAGVPLSTCVPLAPDEVVPRRKRDYAAPRIAVVRDAAFNFYYPENLAALSLAGAELVFVSALKSSGVPQEIDAVYIGGGFPEVHASRLAANQDFLHSLAAAARRDVPIYAECGGLMLLAQSIRWRGVRYPMAAVLPVDVEVSVTPQGHGYVEMEVTEANPFYPCGTVLRGHEFHYSSIAPLGPMPRTACAVWRGTGACGKRDGLMQNQVWASYTHLHATASPEWAEGLVRAAREHRANAHENARPRRGRTRPALP